MFGASLGAPQQPMYNPNKDIEVATPPDLDGISSLAFSPTANFLIATSWNNSAYCWDIQPTGATVAKARLMAAGTWVCTTLFPSPQPWWRCCVRTNSDLICAFAVLPVAAGAKQGPQPAAAVLQLER